MKASTARSPAAMRPSRAWSRSLQHGELFGGRLDNLELKYSPRGGDAVPRLKMRLKKEIVTLGDASVDPTTAVGTYVDAADWNDLIADARHAGARHPQRLRGRDGHLRGRGRSAAEELWRVQGFHRAEARSGQAPQDRDVLHRRHPLREGQRLSARARLCRGLSPQGRHPEISGRRAGEPRAAGAANVLCSTNASRSAMA